MSAESIKRGLAAAAKVFTSKSRSYKINGKTLKCPLCGCASFEHRRVLLNTTVATLVNLDWANSDASAMICEDCSHIMWFYKEPERIL
jgi:predicted nucleic-acid-binding Zn-ribbon protein